MYDGKKVLSIISDIEKFKEEIKTFGVKNVKDLESPIKLRASSMNIFGILNRLIDLGTELLSENKVGTPSRYEEIMPLLTKAGITNKETAEKIGSLIKKRNYFAHFYQDVSEKEVFNVLQNLDVIEPFIRTIKSIIKKSSKL